MNRKIQLISAISLLSLGIGSAWAAVSVKVKCEDMGYTTPLEKCLDVGGSPLFCPFFDAKDNPMVLCIKSSCRGYPLKAEDLDGKAADGKSIRDHVESVDECSVSPLEDSEKFYKIVKCKTTSLFQNDLCDVGCLAERYPYDSHQGNIAGDMRKCEDNIGTGEHYGYETCNDGWEGGWQKTKDTANPTGKCELSACDVKNFPYMNDPNTEYNRGITKKCLVGGNPYYRYSLTDLMDNPSDEACGVANENTLINAVCQKQCIFSECSKGEPIHVTRSGISFEYNDWSCKLETEDCRIGDEAVIGDVSAGIIVHLPTGSGDRIRILALDRLNERIADGPYAEDSVPLPTGGCNSNDTGLYNDKFLLAYAIEMNKSAEYTYSYPGPEKMQNYAPEGCTGACGKGEWYIPTCWELKEIYNNRYIIYNITKSQFGTAFINDRVISSSYTSGRYNVGIHFSGDNGTGGITSSDKRQTKSNLYRILSFRLK